MEHAVVLFVHFPLVRIRFALHELFAALAAPASEETDARIRRGFIIDDEVGIVAVFALALLVNKRG